MSTTTERAARNLELRIGSEHCFHDTCRVSIVEAWQDGGESGEATVAEVWPADNDADLRDGRLLAAAPELAEALRDAVEELELLTHDESCDHAVGICWCQTFCRLEAARAALRKAGLET